MSVRNSHIQKVDDYHEHQKYNDIEYDNIDFPWKFLQPVHNPKGAKELCKIRNYIVSLPFVYQLNQ